MALVAIAAIQASAYRVGALADRAPQRTAMMKQREAEARRKGKTFRPRVTWTPYNRISPLLRRAILIAEDDAFFMHGGMDWNEIQAAARENLEKRRVVRGGSTITQQLAKNLYLGDQRTPQRKLAEMFLAHRLERSLGKRRIFELYLNLIEWGDGIFGAEAAARHYFGVSASGLSERQAVLLAAVIINPRRYSVLHPNRRIERRVRLIASRMRRRGFLTENQYLAAIGKAPEPERGALDWLFGRPLPQFKKDEPKGEPWAPVPGSDSSPAPEPEPEPAAPDSL